MNQTLSYEQARDELAEVVKRLEAGGLTLEESLDLWERGERLAAICAEWLEGARARIATAMAQRAAGPGADGPDRPAARREGGRGARALLSLSGSMSVASGAAGQAERGSLAGGTK